MLFQIVAYQTNSLQTEQKVGWGKNVALNSWHLTTWTLACLMAPRLWWRANRPSLSRSDSGSPSVWPGVSETHHTSFYFKHKTDANIMQLWRSAFSAFCKQDFTLRFPFLTFCGLRSVYQSFTLTKELFSYTWYSLAAPLFDLGLIVLPFAFCSVKW